MRIVAFHQSAFEQYNDWALSDKKTFERLVRLITETAKTPFTGIGVVLVMAVATTLIAPPFLRLLYASEKTKKGRAVARA